MPHCPHWWAQVRKASTQTFTVLSTSNTTGINFGGHTLKGVS